MLISHRHRFIFIKAHKTAGTSIELALHPHLGTDDVVGPLRTDGPEAQQIERNRTVPWQRWHLRDWARFAVSGTLPRFQQHSAAWLVRRYYPDLWKEYFTFAVERNSWELAVSAHAWYAHRHQPITFEEFVSSGTLVSYSNWPLYTFDGEIAVNRIIRYDQLDKGLAEVTERLGLPRLNLPHAKAGHRPRRPYQERYTPETRDRVAELFHREIECFGWTFD